VHQDLKEERSQNEKAQTPKEKKSDVAEAEGIRKALMKV
jgi:hypothetical protein